MRRENPPAGAQLLLHVCLRAEDREFILGDLLEEYTAVVLPRRGRAGAWRWYWRQAIGTIVSRRLAGLNRRAPSGAGMPSSRGGALRRGIELSSTIRMLARTPLYAATVLLLLVLGIGVTTAVWTIIDGVLLEPLPYAHPERLVQVFETERDVATGDVEMRGYFAWRNFADLRDQADAFDGLAAWQYYDRTLTGSGTAVRLAGRMVTADFFAVLGIAPALGRHFIRSDYETGSPEAAILSNGVWRSAFGGDSSVIDREVLLDGLPHRIVGVMPAAFAFPYDADLWMPLFPELGPDDEGARRYHRYRVAGLLATGATRTTAQAQVSTIASRLEAEHPETNRDNGFSVVSLLDVVVGEAEPALRALLGAVALLLLIACANIAGLFLVRGATRDNELAIRRTLGASRANVIAQLLSEGLLLAMVGGAVGLVVATWLVEGFKQLVGPALPRSEAVALDGSTIAVGIILSIAIGLVSGAAPVLRALRRGSAIVQSGRRTSSSRDVVRFRRMLVVAQLALASVLVVGSVLLARSFAHLSTVETGVEVDGLLALPVSLPEGRYQDAVSRHAFFRAALEQIEQRPEVTGAAAGLVAPLSGFGWGNGLRVEGQAVPENQVPTVSYNVVTPDYFRVAGIAVLEGRALEERDGQEAVVVNRITAERTWPGQSAIGQRIRFRDDSPWSTVVGVVAAVPSAAGEAAVAGVYVPIAFEQLATMTLIVRHDGDPGLAITAVRNVIAGLDSEVPITRIVSLRDTIAETLARPRYTAAIVALFGAAALLLACTGVYGVLAYAVAQRSKEMGIRMAIGAAPADLGGLVLREGASLVVLGVSIGLAGAIATARLITGLLYGVSPADPILLSAVGAAIISAGLAACLGPAVRAARTDAQRSIGAD